VVAAAALQPAPEDAGTGRGPDRVALAAEPPVLLAGRVEGIRTSIPAGPAGPAARLLVLAQASDAGWRATLDGRPLAPRTAWGWAQAFALPPAGGTIEVHRDSRRQHLLLVGTLVALLLVVVLAAPTLGRDSTALDALDPVRSEPAADRRRELG